MPSPQFESLNAAQRAAVEHLGGPLLILAGPGSGKTRVVTCRIANLLTQGICGADILALTFTNKAADEMRQRLERIAPGERVWIGTFHRFCAQLLRRYAPYVGLRENFSIADVDDSRRLLKLACQEANVDLELTTPESLAQAISWAKNNLISPAAYEPRTGSVVGALVARVYPLYHRQLLRANVVDFDDLLLHVALLLRNNADLRARLDRQFRYILVDEYQDTNLAQYAIVRALSIDHPNLAVTGDPDQSIYGWRGANLSNILEFERDYPAVRVVRLEQNYRSTQRILRVADELIRHNVRRKHKELYCDNPPGQPVRLVEFTTQQDEAEQIAGRIAADVRAGRRRPADFAILYRVNALSRSLEHALREHQLAYQIIHGVEFYQRQEVKDLLAYLQLVNNPANDAAFQRVVNRPARQIGDTTVERLRGFAQQQAIPLFEAARRCGVVPQIKPRAAVAVARFVALVDRLRERATAPVGTLLRQILDETDYRAAFLAGESTDDQDRLANIEELLVAADEFDQQHPEEPPLERFLEQAALVNDTDDLASEVDRVTLMTLHAAKGLEYSVVFIVGIEQGLIPHERSRQDESQLEEERRLLFVGITRARHELQLSYCQYRVTHGLNRAVVPSPFLMELPRGEMEIVTAPRRYGGLSESPSWPRLAAAGDPDACQLEPARFEDVHDEPAADAFGSDDDPRAMPGDDDDPTPARSMPGARGRSNAASASAALSSLVGKVQTAADLEARQSAAGGGAAAWSAGMRVRHPEYGDGQIVRIVGAGPKRQATVAFDDDGTERHFRLVHAHLRPIE